MEFKDLKLNLKLLEGLQHMGFKNPTPIQKLTIPLILSGNDIIATAQTGTGKTAAFLLPIIDFIMNLKTNNETKALVIVPTRELAIQIDQQLEGLSYYTSVSSFSVFGGGEGDAYSNEKSALNTGTDVIISTPGRLISHLNMGNIRFDSLKFLILDEADRMLDMGFHKDIMKIISFLPKERQNLMFSATMPEKIKSLTKIILNNPKEISISVSKPAEKIIQAAFFVDEKIKIELIKFILNKKSLKKIIIFCGTKNNAKILNKKLKNDGFQSAEIHSDLSQNERENIIIGFKNNKIPIIVATDILSRGIDVEDIDLVINFDVPKEAEDYIHRIGRTARAESNGVAFTLVNKHDIFDFNKIEKLLKKPIPKVKLPKSIL